MKLCTFNQHSFMSMIIFCIIFVVTCVMNLPQELYFDEQKFYGTFNVVRNCF